MKTKTYLLLFSLVSTFAFLKQTHAQSCGSGLDSQPNKVLSALDEAKDSVEVMHTKYGLGMVLFLNKAEGSLIYIAKNGTSIRNVSFDDIYLPLPKTVSCKEEIQEGISFQFEGATFRTVGQFADGSVMAENLSGFWYLKRIDIKNLEPGVLALSKDVHVGDKVFIADEENRIRAEVLSIEGIYAKVTYEQKPSIFVDPNNSVETVTRLVPLSDIIEILETNEDSGLL